MECSNPVTESRRECLCKQPRSIWFSRKQPRPVRKALCLISLFDIWLILLHRTRGWSVNRCISSHQLTSSSFTENSQGTKSEHRLTSDYCKPQTAITRPLGTSSSLLLAILPYRSIFFFPHKEFMPLCFTITHFTEVTHANVSGRCFAI